MQHDGKVRVQREENWNTSFSSETELSCPDIDQSWLLGSPVLGHLVAYWPLFMFSVLHLHSRTLPLKSVQSQASSWSFRFHCEGCHCVGLCHLSQLSASHTWCQKLFSPWSLLPSLSTVSARAQVDLEKAFSSLFFFLLLWELCL